MAFSHIAYFLEGDGVSGPEAEAIYRLKTHARVFVIERSDSDRLAARAVDYACALSPFLVPPMFADRYLRVDPPAPPEPPREPLSPEELAEVAATFAAFAANNVFRPTTH